MNADATLYHAPGTKTLPSDRSRLSMMPISGYIILCSRFVPFFRLVSVQTLIFEEDARSSTDCEASSRRVTLRFTKFQYPIR